MKPTFFLIFYFAIFSIQAQKLNKQQSDSIERIIDNTYLLNDNSEQGKVIEIANGLLEFLEQRKDTLLLSKLYSSLSYSYSELGDKDKAFNYGFKAIELNKAKKDTISLILDYNDIGVTYQDFGLNDKAIESFLKASSLAEKIGDVQGGAFPMYNIANILVSDEKKYKEAEPYLVKILNYTKNNKNDFNQAFFVELYVTLGIVYHKSKRFKESEFYFEKAYKIAKEEKYLSGILNYYKKKTVISKDEKKFEEAVFFMEKANTIYDSIEKRKEIDLVKKIETQYKLKENEDKFKLIEKESVAKELLLKESERYNTILVILSVLLMLAVYLAFRNNKKLKIAKNRAEQLTKAKSDFYSEISHELRTPLYAVIELSGLLLKENITEGHKEYLESLNFSANHLMALVNNVLELNKVESGKLSLQKLNVNLEKLFSNVISSLEYALIQSNNTISLSYDNNIPENLTGDSLKISQVMINLISNAIKFTKDGHINIIVKKIGETKDEINLYFEVSDNGAGISQENQNKIFDAYYQDEYQPDQTYKGTGLGLSIVHRLLKIMGTKINIESEINKGSKFYFELPFTFYKGDKTLQNSQEKLSKNIKGLHLLIVDDNTINQLVTSKLLRNLEASFDIVDSGVKAIEIAKKKTFDCILMDLHMPGMDGYTASNKIRKFNSEIPIVAFTAANSEDVDDRIKKSAMNACIYKPFFTSELIETIHSVISKPSKLN